jgi:hypothetical protein
MQAGLVAIATAGVVLGEPSVAVNALGGLLVTFVPAYLSRDLRLPMAADVTLWVTGAAFLHAVGVYWELLEYAVGHVRVFGESALTQYGAADTAGAVLMGSAGCLASAPRVRPNDEDEALAQHGVPQSICDEEPRASKAHRGIAEPVFAADRDGIDVLPEYRTVVVEFRLSSAGVQHLASEPLLDDLPNLWDLKCPRREVDRLAVLGLATDFDPLDRHRDRPRWWSVPLADCSLTGTTPVAGVSTGQVGLLEVGQCADSPPFIGVLDLGEQVVSEGHRCLL